MTRQFIEESIQWGLKFQKVSPSPSWWGVGQQAGRYGIEAVVDSLHLIHKHEAKKES